MKSNQLLTLMLSGAMLLPVAALAQTANSGTASGDSATATSAQDEKRGEGRERGEKFAKELNLTSDQQADFQRHKTTPLSVNRDR